MKSIIVTGLTTLLLLGGASGVALADAEGDGKKAEKDLKKAEKNQGKRGAQKTTPFDNPLKKILDLMDKVEQRLFDADTGSFTQKEQKRIVDALRFEDKTSAALDELIKKVEQQQQKQQQQQKNQMQRQRQKQQQKRPRNETPQQRKERLKRERQEKERERKRQAQKRKQQQKNQPKNGRKSASKQKKQDTKPPKDARGKVDGKAGAAGRWGNLPSKLHQDAANAVKHPTPGRWSDLIKRYRKRLSDSK